MFESFKSAENRGGPLINSYNQGELICLIACDAPAMTFSLDLVGCHDHRSWF